MYPMFYPIPLMYPKLPTNCDLPPTLYAIMNSMANFDKSEKIKIKDLSLATHEEIFDFDYPLTNKILNEDFEVLILNHFMMRRIGYDTFTAFQIALNVKLNEIMPYYNKLFDMLDGWNLFNDGEIISRTQTNTNTSNDTSSNTTTNNISDSNTNSITNTSDRRYSKMPENDLQNVKDGKYITDYNFDTDTSSSNNTNTSSSTTNSSSNKNLTDNGSLNETITRTPSDKIRIYNEFIENKNKIYSMIFRDLDSLFYGLA